MIEISEKAKSAIHQMILDKNIADLFLRVGIEDGGCSGLSYNIKLDDLLTEEDEVLPTETFNIVWDKRSIEFLEGIKIDYQNQGMTGGFTMTTLMRKPPAAAARASEQQPTKETVKSVTELIIEIYFINPDICIDCGACEAACPVEAVYYEEDLPEQQIKYAAKAREFFKTQ